MTYTVLGHCPCTGRLGIATATFSMATGARAGAIRAHVGIGKTQAKPQPENDIRAVDLLAKGYRPARVLELVAEGEPFWLHRQMGVLDRDGFAAAHTGPHAFPFAGHHAEHGLVVLGNSVAGPHVIEAIATGFKARPDAPLEQRLLQALEGGRDAGGQARAGRWVPERSSVLRVAGHHDYLDIDIAVDRERGAIDELRRVLEAFMVQEHAGTHERIPTRTMTASAA